VLVELSVVEQRLLAVTEVIRDGLTMTEVAGRYGVSRQSVHNWLRRYAGGGLQGLEDRSRRPRGRPHQMPAQVPGKLVQHGHRVPSAGGLFPAGALTGAASGAGAEPASGVVSWYRTS
jgi:hypothetical protein